MSLANRSLDIFHGPRHGVLTKRPVVVDRADQRHRDHLGVVVAAGLPRYRDHTLIGLCPLLGQLLQLFPGPQQPRVLLRHGMRGGRRRARSQEGDPTHAAHYDPCQGDKWIAARSVRGDLARHTISLQTELRWYYVTRRQTARQFLGVAGSRVGEGVTPLAPHGPGRADFPHPVLHLADSLQKAAAEDRFLDPLGRRVVAIRAGQRSYPSPFRGHGLRLQSTWRVSFRRLYHLVSPSLPWVLPGGVSQVRRVLLDTTTSPYPYRTTYGFVARLQPQPSSSLGQVRGRCLPPGSLVSGPAPWDRCSRLGIRGPHRFLGCPFCAFALLFDPGRTSAPHRLGASVLPPYPIRRRLPRVTISGLHHTALAPAVYASWPASLPGRMQDSLAAGGEPLPRGN